jgi:hypothetical protein
MTALQTLGPRLRIVPLKTGPSMQELIAFIRAQAANIDDTAKRCTDPVIISELRYISAEMRAEAAKAEAS